MPKDASAIVNWLTCVLVQEYLEIYRASAGSLDECAVKLRLHN